MGEILERGGHVSTGKVKKSLQESSDENAAHFHLFLSESRNACDRAMKTLEVDKTVFMSRAKETKDNL